MKAVGSAVVIPLRSPLDGRQAEVAAGDEVELAADADRPSTAFCELLSNCLDEVEDLMTSEPSEERSDKEIEDDAGLVETTYVPDFAFFGTLFDRINSRLEGLDGSELESLALNSVTRPSLTLGVPSARPTGTKQLADVAGPLANDEMDGVGVSAARAANTASDPVEFAGGGSAGGVRGQLSPSSYPEQSLPPEANVRFDPARLETVRDAPVDSGDQSAFPGRDAGPVDALGGQQPAVEHREPFDSASSSRIIWSPVVSSATREPSASQQVATGVQQALRQVTDIDPTSVKLARGLVRIRLHPEELGGVEVTVRKSKSRLEVRVVLEREEAVRLMKDSQSELLRALTGVSQSASRVDLLIGTQQSMTSLQSNLTDGGNSHPSWNLAQDFGGGSGEKERRDDNQYVRPGPDAIHKEDKGVIDDTLGHRRASLSAIYV
jgi:Flagellar hook-length control protein FliK